VRRDDRAYDASVTDRRSRPLLDGNVIRLSDVTCWARASAPAEDEVSSSTEVIVPLRGCFEMQRGRERRLADATSVVVFRSGEEHRIGHPTSGGDDCLAFALRPDIAEDVLDTTASSAIVEPTVRLRAHRLRAALRRGALDDLEAEDAALDLVRTLARAMPHGSGPMPSSPRAAVERARVLLASRPAERWRLDRIGREAFVSPAHLARQFRLLTGESISRYLLRLRLALALNRLAAGEPDIAGLAGELGFTHHSHFTARFRATFGITPSAFRASLDTERLAELRTMVTAPDRAAS
jgi:AraC-like DNA-binding protein